VSGWQQHLMVAPVVLPLLAAAVMLFADESSRRFKVTMSLFTTYALLGIAIYLLVVANAQGETFVGVYRLGDWAAPFGIVLVVDRLSAVLLLLTAVLGITSLTFALAHWSQAGQRFYAVFLLQLMGLNGAFLAGDLFNLFVFFEVLLAASYGLALHGYGRSRVTAGLHYIVINVTSSTLFLIGTAMIYGVTGTLNLADLALRFPALEAGDLGLFQAGAAILGVAFLTKAAMWPLSFWLPATYSVAAPPVAAIFVVLSKVGVYVVLRFNTLVFGNTDVGIAGFGQEWLLYGGLVTIAFGAVGILSAKSLARLASYSVLVSSGTLLASIGTGQSSVVSGALYYLLVSTLAVSAMYLIAELIRRGRASEPEPEPVFSDEQRLRVGDEFEGHEVGIVLPATVTLLGSLFLLITLLLSGMPPLAGFLAKFTIMWGVLKDQSVVPAGHWVLIAFLIASGLFTLVALIRIGIDAFWTKEDLTFPDVRLVEVLPIAVLIGVCVALTFAGGPAMRYFDDTAAYLADSSTYTRAVVAADPPPIPEALLPEGSNGPQNGPADDSQNGSEGRP